MDKDGYFTKREHRLLYDVKEPAPTGGRSTFEQDLLQMFRKMTGQQKGELFAQAQRIVLARIAQRRYRPSRAAKKVTGAQS